MTVQTTAVKQKPTLQKGIGMEEMQANVLTVISYHWWQRIAPAQRRTTNVPEVEQEGAGWKTRSPRDSPERR